MNKKSIFVFWDGEKSFENTDDYAIKVITCYDDFLKLGSEETAVKAALKNADGFIVLCELGWSHEEKKTSALDYSGVDLVQQFIRMKLGLKSPVVFASFQKSQKIIAKRYEAGIILTPALQHRFIQLPDSNMDLLKCFDGMRNMSDVELVYTRQQYCGLGGLLHQIKHTAEGRSPAEQKPYRVQVEYVVERQFKNVPDYQELLDKCQKTTNVSAFCEELLRRIETDGKRKTMDYPDFFVPEKRSQIKVLLVDDEAETDSVIQRFVKFIQKKNKNNRPGSYYLFREPDVAKGPMEIDELAPKITDGEYRRTMAANPEANLVKRYAIADHDVVICDIELRNAQGELEALGFNIIEQVIHNKLFYIVTNVTRSIFDLLKMPGVSRIRLKEDVFGSNEKIQAFLYGIKEVWEEKRKKDMHRYAMVFDRLYYALTNTDTYYPISFTKKDNSNPIVINDYSELEQLIRTECLNLIKQLFKECKKITHGTLLDSKGFDEVCFQMRYVFIPVTIGLGNEDLSETMSKRGYRIESEDVDNFIVKLILRRFFLYMVQFLEYHSEIKKDFDSIIDLKGIEKKWKCTNDHLACRAISSQYKYYRKSDDNEGQSHCLDKVLLLSAKPKNRTYSKEEAAFMGHLESNRNNAELFDFSSDTPLNVF